MSHASRNALAFAIAIALAAGAAAQEPTLTPPPDTSGGVIPLQYVGTNARIALGVDQDGRVAGELLGVFGHDGERAFLTQSWLGAGGAGGVQLDYHWLVGRDSAGASVVRLFGAVDQNRDEDRKATIGLGFERASLGLDLYYSRALSDERLIAQELDSTTETIFGTIDERPFRRDITIDTLTESLEHPYEHGVGLRVSRFFEPALLRLRAGLDYERGEALLQGDAADQLNAMVGVEKHFRGSGHSLALEVEHFRKDGPFIQRVTQTRTEGPLVLLNRAPTAQDDSAQTTQDSPINIAVLANDTDGDGDSLSVSAVTDPAGGTASSGANGTITYSPDAGFVGTDIFAYTIEDGNGGSATATITVTVAATPPVNNPAPGQR